MNQIFVVDQNFMRDEGLRIILRKGSSKIVLPDAAFFEMCKAKEWKSTLRNSLEILSGSPNDVHVSAPVNELISWEEKNKQGTKSVISKKYTKFARDLLREVAEQREGAAHREIDLHIQQRAVRSDLDQEACKRSVAKLNSSVKSSLSQIFLGNLRSGLVDDAALCREIRRLAPDCALNYFRDIGMSREKAASFCRKNPMLIRRIYLNVLNSTEWIVAGGYEGLSAKKAENEVIDQEYILTATYFDGILTKEVDAKSLHRKLRMILKIPQGKDARLI
jgi:hypothetical protein